MADYAVNRLNAKTAAVFVQTGSDYSEGLKNAFVEEAEKLGLEIVAEEAFPEGDKDFKAQMTNIAAKDPDVVFCPIYYGEAGLAITAARQAGCTATFLGGDGFGSSHAIGSVSASRQGLRKRRGSAGHRLLLRLRARYGKRRTV